jgi:predicted DNA binding CopG/RHH family protein
MSKAEVITAERLDQLVDEDNEDVLQYFDLEHARRGGPGVKRINIDMPSEFLADLDQEAARRGITRQSLIKVWLYEKLHSGSVIVQLKGEMKAQRSQKVTSGVFSILDLGERKGTCRICGTKTVRSAKGAAKRLIRREGEPIYVPAGPPGTKPAPNRSRS